MNICHVVTLLDGNGAFGGPSSVALTQAQVLQDRGHNVQVIAAGGDNWRDGAHSVPTRTFRAVRWSNQFGFGGLASPGLWLHVRRLASKTDVFHFHLGRDAVTLPACLVVRQADAPYVVQTHGMVMPDRRAVVSVVDYYMTRRALAGATKLFYLTEVERAGLTPMAPRIERLSRLVNGVEITSLVPRRPRSGVLFCSRLHPRKRVLSFVDMALELTRRGVEQNFGIVGPDEGDLPAVNAAIARLNLTDAVVYEGSIPPDRVMDRLAKAEVFVLPSRDEPFPMIVLEAMAVGTPVVLTDSCHISGELGAADAAVVCDGTPKGLAGAVATLLENPDLAQRLSRNAVQLLTSRFALARVGDTLEVAYRDAVNR